MATIGSRSMAKVICDYHERTQDSQWDNLPRMPEGWSRVGSGGFRTAYLGPDGVVYKCGADDKGENYGSRFEVAKARRLSRKAMPDFIRIPRTSGFSIGNRYVVAMEYIQPMVRMRRCNGETYFGWQRTTQRCTCKRRKETRALGMCIQQVRLAVEKATRCSDMHLANFIIGMDGFVYPIDMGSPANEIY